MAQYAVRKLYEKLYEKSTFTRTLIENFPIKTFFNILEKQSKKLANFGSYFLIGIEEYKTYADFKKAKKFTYDYIFDRIKNIKIDRKKYESIREVIDFKEFRITPLGLAASKGLGYYFLLSSKSNLSLLMAIIMVLCPSLFEMYLDNKFKRVID